MDYILDFHRDLTCWLKSELADKQELLQWGGIDISRAVFNYLWYSHLEDRDDYIKFRENHPDSKYFSNSHITIPDDEPTHNDLVKKDLYHHPWKKILTREAGQILVYADSERRLKYLMPIIIEISTPTIILTRSYNVPNEIINKSNISVLPLSLLNTSAIMTSGLFKISPLLTSYIHTIYCLINWLRPKKIICCDGCQTQYQLAAIFGKQLSIDCECYQFGWPGYIHAGFSDLPYSSFFTWGKIYSDLMAPHNPNVKFTHKGRLGNFNTSGTHNCISFFLQAPVFVSSKQYLSEFYEAIIHICRLYPDKTIIVRPHPEAGIDPTTYKLLEKYPNIELNDYDDVEIIYHRTAIAISQYSSCLVESELFGCKAICFNQTHGFVYDALPQTQRAYTVTDLIHLIADFQ